MSYKHIDTNLPWLNDTIGDIIDEHKGRNGIIHTASYNLTMKIYEGLSSEHRKRVLIYEGTEQKRMVLEQLKLYKDKILMGPSLLEGLDLKHDWSRFQIFAKVPYLSLADKFVKAKLDMNPGWYRWKAILNILQGIGRSIRSEDDWAVTYILDASLSDLIRQHPKAFPPEFMKRIRVRKE
jgi:Rad3-related DNA helicase